MCFVQPYSVQDVLINKRKHLIVQLERKCNESYHSLMYIKTSRYSSAERYNLQKKLSFRVLLLSGSEDWPIKVTKYLKGIASKHISLVKIFNTMNLIGGVHCERNAVQRDTTNHAGEAVRMVRFACCPQQLNRWRKRKRIWHSSGIELYCWQFS